MSLRVLIASLLLLSPLAVAAPGGPLQPLAAALDDAQAHAAPLAEHAATAPAMSLAMPTDDELGALSAVVAADEALAHITREQPAALHHGSGDAMLAELNAAHEALSLYTLARADGDRERMRSAARDAVEALARADALVSEARPYPLVHSR